MTPDEALHHAHIHRTGTLIIKRWNPWGVVSALQRAGYTTTVPIFSSSAWGWRISYFRPYTEADAYRDAQRRRETQWLTTSMTREGYPPWLIALVLERW